VRGDEPSSASSRPARKPVRCTSLAPPQPTTRPFVMLFSSTPTTPGLLVTVDGPNGAGKSTLVSALACELGPRLPVYATRQPSPTPLGAMIRSSEQSFHGRALACLVAADRHHQVESELLPQLREGRIVICDRYVESSLVLQALDGVPLEDIIAINRGVLRPDVRFRLKVPAAALQARLGERERTGRERFELAPDAAERELVMYARADDLLAESGALSIVLDTGVAGPSEIAVQMAEAVRARFSERSA